MIMIVVIIMIIITVFVIITVDGPQEPIGSTFADLLTVSNARFDGVAEVNANENPR